MTQPKNNLKTLDILRLILLTLLFPSLFFSYYPLISLGSNSTMNFELSIPLIILFLFVILSVPDICRFACDKTFFVRRRQKLSLLALLIIPLYATISLCWTVNILRGALTTGVLWCISLALLSACELFATGKIPTITPSDKIQKTKKLLIAVLSFSLLFLPFLLKPLTSTELSLTETNKNHYTLVSTLAFNIWNNDSLLFIFGHGIGSSGVAMHDAYSHLVDEKEIIQNEPLAILVELGVMGLIFVIILIAALLRIAKKYHFLPLAIALLITSSLSLLFFSGLPNALHLYLFPLLLLPLCENHLIIDDISDHHRR